VARYSLQNIATLILGLAAGKAVMPLFVRRKRRRTSAG
jgi:hypothetical protein